MITLFLSGGLGNQMFQYAAGLSLAKKNNTGLCLDLSEFAHYELRNYMLDQYDLPDNVSIKTTTGSKLALRLAKYKPGGNTYFEPHYHVDPHFFDLGENATIHGYFQSEEYFKAIEGDIRKHLTLSALLSEKSIQIAQKIKDTPIAISLHVRRGDYATNAKTQQVHGSASDAYYHQAIATAQALYGETVTFFIFSDDPDYVEKAFEFCKNKHIVRGNDAAPQEDIHLMSLCHHHILANSSFSWWGAWLNASNDKTIIAPRQWFARETLLKKNITDLFPRGWITI